MATRKRSKEKAPKKCRDCEHWGEVSEKVRVHELLESTIAKMEDKLKGASYEPTVAEYVKLLQLEREIGQEDEPKEIKVTWVGPEKSETEQ